MERKHVLAVFLDVQGAFDNVNIDILLTKLSSIGCSTRVIEFISFLARERLILTAYTGEEIRRLYKVPQGGRVLSPLLYLIYVSNIADGISSSVTLSQFADDIAASVKSRSIKRCKNLLQKAVDKIGQNLFDLGLELSPGKTQLLHFNNQKIVPGNSVIKIKEHTVKSCESVRFLGIIFDYELIFNHHVDHVYKKCSRALNIIKYLCGTWWGSSPVTLLCLYKSLIRSSIDYGSYIYFPSTK